MCVYVCVCGEKGPNHREDVLDMASCMGNHNLGAGVEYRNQTGPTISLSIHEGGGLERVSAFPNVPQERSRGW